MPNIKNAPLLLNPLNPSDIFICHAPCSKVISTVQMGPLIPKSIFGLYDILNEVAGNCLIARVIKFPKEKQWWNIQTRQDQTTFWPHKTRGTKNMLKRRRNKTQDLSNDCIFQTLLSCLDAVDDVFCPQREIERMSDGRNTNSILYQSKMDVYPSNLSHNCKICYMKCEIMEICDAM